MSKHLLSLLSGAGGLDLGLELAGFDVAVAVDHDEWACQTHGHNSNALVLCRDLQDPDATRRFLADLKLPPVALVAGGFPCQPYSRAGSSIIRHLVHNQKREAVDPGAFAWESFVAAVAELRPAQCLAENVPDITRFNDGQLLEDVARSLEELGYQVDIRVLLARQHGVPQYRERLFIQGALADTSLVWPRPVDDAPAVTLHTAIGDMPVVGKGETADPIEYVPRPGEAAPIVGAREAR